MKLGLTARLFVSLCATSLVVAFAVSAATRASLRSGFLDYLADVEQQRLDSLVGTLAQAYGTHGDWAFLREHPDAWRALLRENARAWAQQNPLDDERRDPSIPRPPPVPAPPPSTTGTPPGAGGGPMGPARVIRFQPRITLLDEAKQVVVGVPNVSSGGMQRPIVVAGRTVGYVTANPRLELGNGAERRFLQRQLESAAAIAACVMAISAAVAWWTTRRAVAPLKRLADATHRLTRGEYDARAEVDTNDEIGHLAHDFNRMAQTLEGNERARRAYMADIAHELRTPLAVLRGEIEALEDGVRAVTPASLASLRSEVAQLAKLVDDLSQLALADHGALQYELVALDLAALVRDVFETARPRFAERAIALDLDVAASPPVRVRGDRARLTQVLANLIENTLRYTDRAGRARVHCTRVGSHVELTLEDSAPGVPAEAIERLFDRFYRADASRSRERGGFGLGLSIVRAIVEAHDATIDAAPSSLGGLRIRIAFLSAEESP